jgi:hypothetical protein
MKAATVWTLRGHVNASRTEPVARRGRGRLLFSNILGNKVLGVVTGPRTASSDHKHPERAAKSTISWLYGPSVA